MPPFAQSWRNWFGNQRSEPSAYHKPRRGDELPGLVAAPGPWRPLGTSYAWSALVPVDPSGRLISAERLCRLLDVDRAAGVIHVEAGMTIRELVEIAETHGLSVPGAPIFDGMSIGGAISTASHGSGQQHRALSDYIDELTLIDAGGKRHVLGRGKGPGDDFLAACAGLGALGVIESVKVRCDRAHNLEVIRGRRSLHDVLDQLDDLLASHEFVDLQWFFSPDSVQVLLKNRTDAPVDRAGLSERIRHAVAERAAALAGNTVLPFLSRESPHTLYWLLKAIYAVGSPIQESEWRERAIGWLAKALRPFTESETCAVQSVRDANHYVHSFPMALAMEIVVPKESAAAAIRRVVEVITEHGDKERRLPVNLAVYMRFMRRSEALLSPARGDNEKEGVSCTLDISTTLGDPDTERFLAGLYEQLVGNDALRGLPHWGKLIPQSMNAQTLRDRYGDRWERFEAVRRRFDTSGRLLNEFLGSLFNEPGAAAQSRGSDTPSSAPDRPPPSPAATGRPR